MPAKPAKREASGLPVAFDPDLDRLGRQLIAFIEEGGRSVEIRRELTPDEKTGIQTRAAALEACLAPYAETDLEAIDSALAALFSGFRSMRQTGADVVATVTITRAVLRNFPAWAIEEACLKIARGDAGLDLRYPPNDAQIADVVRDVMKRRKSALDDAKLLLEAKVVAPAPRVERFALPQREPQAESHEFGPLSPERAAILKADLEGRRRRNEGRQMSQNEAAEQG